jgi:16S rRNA processing protein RimM
VEVVVARLGRPHGVHGELSIELRTDVPERRFTPGAVFTADPGGQTLTLRGVRDHNGRLLLTFDEVGDRTAAERLRDVLLVADVPETDEPDAWPTDHLVGLRAVTVEGRDVGVVVDLEHLPAQDLLVVETATGDRVLVPFVTAIVPEVDVEGGRVLLDPPGGLLEG